MRIANTMVLQLPNKYETIIMCLPGHYCDYEKLQKATRKIGAVAYIKRDPPKAISRRLIGRWILLRIIEYNYKIRGFSQFSYFSKFRRISLSLSRAAKQLNKIFDAIERDCRKDLRDKVPPCEGLGRLIEPWCEQTKVPIRKHVQGPPFDSEATISVTNGFYANFSPQPQLSRLFPFPIRGGLLFIPPPHVLDTSKID